MKERVRKSEVLRYLGFANQQLEPELDARIDDAIALCCDEVEPLMAWRTFDLVDQSAPGRPAFAVKGTTLLLEGETARTHLQDAISVAVLACTLGLGAEKTLRVLGAKNPLDQVLFNAVCTELVECATDEAQEQAEGWARQKGCRIGSRFSPGYGDLKLELQPVILQVLDAQRTLGLTCTDDNLLIPTKSVTAFIGIFKDEVEKKPVDPCSVCLRSPSCLIRAAGGSCANIAAKRAGQDGK